MFWIPAAKSSVSTRTHARTHVHTHTHIHTPRKPNVTTEWLTPLLHIREDLGSNIGPETGYPD
jgi:hypothetical protein